MAKLVTMCKGPQDAFKEHMIRSQIAAVHEFIFDPLRLQGSVDGARKRVPDWFLEKDFANLHRWKLGLGSCEL